MKIGLAMKNESMKGEVNTGQTEHISRLFTPAECLFIMVVNFALCTSSKTYVKSDAYTYADRVDEVVDMMW